MPEFVDGKEFGAWINSTKAERRVAIFDACCSAAMLKEIDGCVIAVDSLAFVHPEAKRSSLTCALLEGLYKTNADGELDVREWFGYAQDETAKFVKNGSEKREKVVFRVDENFPILKGKSKDEAASLEPNESETPRRLPVWK